MDKDDIGSQQLVLTGDALTQDRAVVDDELQVEFGDAYARIALARRHLPHVTTAPSKAKVTALDRVEEQRLIQLLHDRVHEHRIALELGEPEGGS